MEPRKISTRVVLGIVLAELFVFILICALALLRAEMKSDSQQIFALIMTVFCAVNVFYMFWKIFLNWDGVPVRSFASHMLLSIAALGGLYLVDHMDTIFSAVTATHVNTASSSSAYSSSGESSSSAISSFANKTISAGIGFVLNDFTMDFPEGSTLVSRPSGDGSEAYDVFLSDGKTGMIRCPIHEGGYENMTFSKRERLFSKNDMVYGATLWTGKPTQPSEDGGYQIVFMHRNDFDHWGNTADNANHSCEIMIDDAAFAEALYESVR